MQVGRLGEEGKEPGGGCEVGGMGVGAGSSPKAGEAEGV